MSFADILNQYIEQLNCPVRDIAMASGLSDSVISRYRSGERTPGMDSEQLTKLALGIAQLMPDKKRRGRTDTYGTILEHLRTSLNSGNDAVSFSAKVDCIVTELNLNVSAMAKSLNYDVSFISRIRTGSRMPSDVAAFARKFIGYLLQSVSAEKLVQFLEAQEIEIPESERYPDFLSKYLEIFLLNTSLPVQSQPFDFLHKLDDFNLNEYIRSVHFNELRVSSVPFQFHTYKKYSGIDGQKKGELDFFKGTVLSKSEEAVFMFSEMDMAEMAEDIDFSQKWMLGLAMALKRGINITIIHNLNRPFKELMLGLEAWIPLYMTGQVTPYYLSGLQNELYQHLLYTSGAYALSGECLKGYQNNAKYSLTNNKEDVAYYKELSANIIKKALPLMDIYTVEDAEAFYPFSRQAKTEQGNRHYISSSLPLFVLPNDVLASIFKENQISAELASSLFAQISTERENMDILLKVNRILQEIPLLPEGEFRKHPMVLNMNEYNYFTPVSYSYQMYISHIEMLRQYEKDHENYSLKLCEDFAFRNIQIQILEGKWVWISKLKSPPIHFVIRHPQLRKAIENMYTSVYRQRS